MRKAHWRPKARAAELVVRELTEELLVYDLERHQAHCLNQTAARVWRLCDGKKTVREIAECLVRDLHAAVDERIVLFALGQLAEFRLLEEGETLLPEPVRVSRREMMRTLSVATAVTLPLIVSISAPTAAQAASCVNTTCTAGGPPCCVGTCQGGLCVGS
jgi:hypothetical protein